MRTRTVVFGLALAALVPAAAMASSGLFRSAYTETTSAFASGIVAGDFDDNGTVDIVTSNAGAQNEITVLIGFSDGTLTNVTQIPVPNSPSGILLADFDGDDVDDLIVALGNDNAVTFMKGLADQDFFDPPSGLTTVGTGPVALASDDLDGDGARDLVVANEGSDSSPGSVSILRGHGDGSFTLILQDDPAEPGSTVAALPAELGTRAVALGNIDADPALDIVALNSRADSLSLYSGDGGGFFTPRGTLATGASPQDLALVSLDGPGPLDLVIAEGNEDAVDIRLGNGDRTFAPPTSYAVGTSPTRLAVGDLDDNGTLDVVASNNRSGDITVLRGDGMGGFGGARTFVADAEPQALTLADLNADGLLDPVAATQGNVGGSVAVLRNRGAAVLQAVEDVPAGNGPSAVATADVTDDALPDLLVTGDQGTVLVLPALADGGFGTPSSINIGGRGLGVLAVDLNGDTRPDLAAVDNQNNRVAVALATGPNRFGATQLYPVAEGPGNITSGDFNKDGRPDLAVSAIGPPGRVSVLLQQTNGTFANARSTVLVDEETPLGIAALDANCDGRDDVVVANQASDTVSVLRSNGDGTFAIVQTLPGTQVGQGPIAVAAADFNRDGVTDFAVSNSVVPLNNPSVRTFKGDCASGTFTTLSSARAGEVVSAIVARDFTGDQIVDIGLVNQTLNGVRVIAGRADGTLNNPYQSDSVSRMPVAIGAADFDGDGRYDAASANSDPSANNASVLFNCARDPGCDPFQPGPPGSAALRGDGNGDGHRSAADLVAVAAEVMDGDGRQVEAIARGSFGGARVAPGIDANGDGIVNAQDRRAVARRIFGGA